MAKVAVSSASIGPAEVVPSVMVSEDVLVIVGAVLSNLKSEVSTLWFAVTLLAVVTLVDDIVSEAEIAKLISPSL